MRASAQMADVIEMDDQGKAVSDGGGLLLRRRDGVVEYGEFVKASSCYQTGCVEVGTWTKSSFSNNCACVEVAAEEQGIAVRDSKDREGPVLHFTVTEWGAFLAGAKAGEFDHLLA